MPAAGGIHILTGSGVEPVNIGFAPDVVLMFYSNHGVVDTWQTLGGAVGLGVACRQVPGNDDLPANFNAHELWSGNTPSSSYLFNVGYWARQSHGGGDGYAGGVRFFTSTGFSFVYSPGFAGGAGNPIYWLALGDEPELVAKYLHFRIGDEGFKTTGFLPTVAFAVGSGGLSNSDGSITLADSSCPCWGIGTLDESETDIMYLSSGIDNSSIDNYMVGERDDNFMLNSDPIIVAQQHDNGQWWFARNDTQFAANEDPFGFGADNLRLATAVLGGIVGYEGAVLPSSVVDGEVEVEVPFDVHAVIFFCNSPSMLEDFGNEIYGGRAFGFACKDGSQAVVANGGHAFGTTLGPLGMMRFQSGQNAWASNFTESSPGNFALNPSYGSAEITPNGFKVKTSIVGSPMHSINFVALGYADEGAGFFRVVHR